MDNLILFDDPAIRGALLPFTFTRPVADIRIGILKISEKWERYSGIKPGYLTQDYLSVKFPKNEGPALMVNGAVCPNPKLWASIQALNPGEALYYGQNILLAVHADQPAVFQPDKTKNLPQIEFKDELVVIQKSWHIFQFNGEQIRADYKLLTAGRTSQKCPDPHTILYNESDIFIEEGAKIKAAVLNAEGGPIYIGKNTEVQEGSLIRGPFALCEGSTVNMGAKMRGDTTIGPHCKVGGEVSNAVIFGYSNKGHEGFLGNAVLGEWCNMGADSNNSNLKNNYAQVKIWDYTKGGFTNTGLQFCGLMMGDHSKCGINTMFNTGTVVGVGANIFGDGFPRNFIPSFAWGGAAGFSTFQLKKFEETAIAVMKRRGMEFNEVEKEIIQKVFELTRHYRIWDKEA
ncbi:GlmU family protein [Cecembia calidifontis]|jgi:UDP-N-acetylglucosamine diphosphorylase/glucosamine-1-phosphate N-acetyltransferase|uniref:UDP-N-acetylglucosamine diphosphorylase/glucosamine-1-phosphate N-acetyltransferase n=1 Tax=Cecembia calidifontis TaxID=1187080 RepID=A0A4Q7P7N8_9BACT|nr:GlmU family protein [Cecembia calidifontis]RZS96081.1 UDP-N-acetylglucosamine diphosphorylase/glucosamine-1-phosphate N-acetyltransferase [Cecembia calidifontis]